MILKIYRKNFSLEISKSFFLSIKYLLSIAVLLKLKSVFKKVIFLQNFINFIN